MSNSKLENGTGTTEEMDLEDWQLPVAFMKKRHTEIIEGTKTITQTWRMKERMKTVSVALVLCLNVGVDPPDIIKTQPCARSECWIDPLSMSPQKALETVGNNLQKQYERWQPRARYKQSLDPTVDEVKKLCTSLRRNAKEERVLFHYNGHGVPKPTLNGEIWVFNKTYTQYIPLSIYDLQTWMGAPSIYVYDCSNAGTIVEAFKQFANQHEQEYEQVMTQNKGQYPSHLGAPVSFKNCIQLGACSNNQVLPMNPELPADLFTACLTTPIKVALRWFVMQNTAKLIPGITLDLIDKIPGQLNDRRTMLGELNWIFTAITDTIAWNTLPRELFQKLFRQDLLVASLFRNFLLAERIMRSYNCNPVSSPNLPVTNKHAMWQAWDLALDICLSQLPSILEKGDGFVHSPFFAEQLTAFQVWLTFGSDMRSPPEQLPIVLQVLLSQIHRLRALELLGRFLDLGPWAVNLALSVGIFPYVLKLLQSSARELRPLLVFIWAKILAVDSTCQADLVRDNGHKYFLTVLEDVHMPAEHRTMSAFVLACIVQNYQMGQEAARQGNLVSVCLEQLVDPNPLLRQWLAICLGRVWMDFDVARWCGVRDSAHEKLYTLLKDQVPEVRAAALFALGTFMSCTRERSDHANTIDHSVAMTLVNTMGQDGSPLVRQELVVALHWLVLMFENQFLAVAFQAQEEERQRDNIQARITSPSSLKRRISSKDRIRLVGSPVNSTSPILSTSSGSLESSGSGEGANHTLDNMRRVSSSSSITSLGALIGSGSPYLTVPYGSIYSKIWYKLVGLMNDPHPGVSGLSSTVVQHIKTRMTRALNQTTEVAAGDAPYSAPSSPSSKPSYMNDDSPPANLGLSQNGSRPANSVHWNPNSGQQRISFFSSLTRPKRSADHKTSSTSTSASEDESGNISTKTPLVSTEFVEWSCKYFAQSVMKGLYPEETDPESGAHQEKEWRYLRNARVRRESEEEQRKAMFGRLDDQVFINRNANVPSIIKFHPFEPVIAVADRDNFSIWDWEQGVRLSYVANNNPKQSRITSMDFINAHDSTLLMLGSDDGALRVWRNVVQDDCKNITLVTAWQALGEMLPSNRARSGLVTEWDQQSSLLYASGDVRVIRLWDAESEMKVQDIPTGADSCVTSLSCETGQPLLVAGCGDGSIRLFDRRLPSHESRIMTLREHSCWVVNVQVQKKCDAAAKIVSGSVAGDVRFWDIRGSTSIMACMAAHGMTAMAVHPVAGVFACGSANQFISVYTCTGEHLSLIKYHDGFMGQRIGPISCLHFHPYRVSLAAGSTDFLISVYSVDKKR